MVSKSIQSSKDDSHIHASLLEWVRVCRAETSGLRSLAVVFEGPVGLTEAEFEAALWERLQSIAESDSRGGQPYAEGVSADPADPHFALSVGGSALASTPMRHDQGGRHRAPPLCSTCTINLNVCVLPAFTSECGQRFSSVTLQLLGVPTRCSAVLETRAAHASTADEQWTGTGAVHSETPE